MSARTESAAITRIAAKAPQLGAALDGTVDLAEPRAFDLTARIDTPDSPLAIDTRGLAIDFGVMALEAHATGSLSGPVLHSADVAVSRIEGEVLKDSALVLPFAFQPGARIRYQQEPDLITVENAGVTTGTTRVTAAGIFGSPDDTLRVTGAGRLEDFRPLIEALSPTDLADAVFEGPVRLGANLSGTFEQPIVKGNLDLDGARAGDGIRPPFEDIWVRMALDGEQVRLDLVEARWQGAHVAFSGAVPTWFLKLPGSSRTSQRATVSGHVDDVTLKVLEPFLETD